LGQNTYFSLAFIMAASWLACKSAARSADAVQPDAAQQPESDSDDYEKKGGESRKNRKHRRHRHEDDAERQHSKKEKKKKLTDAEKVRTKVLVSCYNKGCK
jgi:hypothetical protein